MITIEVVNIKAVRQALQGMAQQIDVVVQDAVEDTAHEIRNEVINAIRSGPASGRVYTHYMWTDPQGRLRIGRERDKPHQASAPGEAPMTDSGALVASIKPPEVGDLFATVGSPLVYASYLEYGTRKMAPRPIWHKTADKEGLRFRDRVEEGLRNIIR